MRALAIPAALALAVGAALGAWLDFRYGWITPAFDAVAHQFYEVPIVARVRRPSQLMLTRWHLAIFSAYVTLALAAGPWISRHGGAWLAVFGAGYLLRAIIWICGGNLPLVPGDSSHYLEVATSVLRGEGPAMHYVHSYFREYPRILEGKGALSDWDTPLDAYVRAAAFRIAGLGPDSRLDARIVAAKACSFVLNLAALPALYVFARGRYGGRVALGAMAVLAILPVHALYAGFILRESLVALLAILAIWMLTEVWHAGSAQTAYAWALAAGLCGGLAALSRMTTLAMLGAAVLFTFAARGRRRLGPMLLWGVAFAAVCLPWAWATWQEYGSPFYSVTRYFEYNFSWTVHHYEKGNTLPSQFYTSENLPEIARVKLKSLLIIPIYSTMIVGLPLVLGFLWRLRQPARTEPRPPGSLGPARTEPRPPGSLGPARTEPRPPDAGRPREGEPPGEPRRQPARTEPRPPGMTRGRPGRDVDGLVATILAVFVLATLKSIADVTQVTQLARYYMPVFVLMLPGAVAGVLEWLDSLDARRAVLPWLAATYVALVWADPTWSYDATWFARPFQLHWPALQEAGDWVRAHPEQVPPGARIMTWFPWELRVTSDRTTILMPRSYQPRRINEVIRQYGVTHFLWGSFEPPPYHEINPENWSVELDQLRVAIGLTESRELYRSSRGTFFPVRLYRLR